MEATNDDAWDAADSNGAHIEDENGVPDERARFDENLPQEVTHDSDTGALTMDL